MNSEQFWSGVPLTGLAIVLTLFGVSEWVRARRHDRHAWPLSWGLLSALFLLSLGAVAATGAFRVFSDKTPDFYELLVVRAALWVAFVIAVWTCKRWFDNGRDEA